MFTEEKKIALSTGFYINILHHLGNHQTQYELELPVLYVKNSIYTYISQS